MSRNSLKNMIRASLFAALTAVCAWISVPVLNIAFTMQTFAIFLTLGVLGGKWGTASVLVYLLLGAAGVPVFTGFRGGVSCLLGVTGGYIWGFLFAALTFWALERFSKALASAAGMAVCYLCGSVWFSVYVGGAGLWAAFAQCVLPYLVPDALKITLACTLARRLKRYMK